MRWYWILVEGAESQELVVESLEEVAESLEEVVESLEEVESLEAILAVILSLWGEG